MFSHFLRLAAGAAVLLTAACASMAPPPERPAVALPAVYPHGEPPAAAAADPAAADADPAAAIDWRAYFADPALVRLIDKALAGNPDLRTAVLRVQEAQAAYGVQRSARWPVVGVAVDVTRARTPADLSLTRSAMTANQFQAGVGINSWEIDFWGRIASLDEAALQSFLATEAARRAVAIALVAQVADAYLGLRELDERLRLARDSEDSQRESLRIFTRRFEVGSASRLELTQVQTLLSQAEALVVQVRQQRDAQRLALGILLGDFADAEAIADGHASLDEAMLSPVAPGLPSALLLSRPDIAAAEHQLRAANANIGAARAAFFPRIGLTAFGGGASTELDRLFRGANRAWQFAPSLSLPIFDAGRNRANLDLAEVRKHLAVVQYEQVVQNAFRDVAVALSAQHWLQQQVGVQQRTLDTQRERARLSRLSYDNGASSFLDVLDAERNLISAEQQLVQTRRALLSSRVALYAALGGGAQYVGDVPLSASPSLSSPPPSLPPSSPSSSPSLPSASSSAASSPSPSLPAAPSPSASPPSVSSSR
ncbi:MAG: efflux transporter outer membrane subunit [Burkholderiaceae bacterium]